MKETISLILLLFSGLLFLGGLIMVLCLEKIGVFVMFLGLLFFVIGLIIDLVFGDGEDSDDGYNSQTMKNECEDNYEKTIIIKNTRCCACGAPLEDDTCSYCNTKAVIYKKIR